MTLVFQMVSVERVKAYGDLPEEALEHTDHPLPPKWPSDGAIVFDHISLSYGKGKPDSLRDISFSVCAKEKVRPEMFHLESSNY